MSFGRLRQIIAVKCVPHVQHNYFSSFNQSDHCFLASSLPLLSSLLDTLGSLSNHEDDDDDDKTVTNLRIWQWKIIVLDALHEQFSFLYISLPFSSFPQREMTCFAVEWATWAYDDKFSIFSCYLQTADTNLIPGYLDLHFASITTWNNWEIIADTRSYICRWRSRCCRRRPCLSSQITTEIGEIWILWFQRNASILLPPLSLKSAHDS